MMETEMRDIMEIQDRENDPDFVIPTDPTIKPYNDSVNQTSISTS